MNATIQTAPLRVFRISFAWRRYGQLYRATTSWTGTDREHALKKLTAMKPEIISAQILSESAPVELPTALFAESYAGGQS